MTRYIAVDSFEDLPVRYCPCYFHRYTCRANKVTFEVGRMINHKGTVAWVYPRGNEFARQTAIVLQRERP